MRDHLIGRLAQDSRARDGEFPHHRVQFAPAADRAAEPAVLMKIARRVRHHSKNIGVAVLAPGFPACARLISKCHNSRYAPWFTQGVLRLLRAAFLQAAFVNNTRPVILRTVRNLRGPSSLVHIQLTLGVTNRIAESNCRPLLVDPAIVDIR